MQSGLNQADTLDYALERKNDHMQAVCRDVRGSPVTARPYRYWPAIVCPRAQPTPEESARVVRRSKYWPPALRVRDAHEAAHLLLSGRGGTY